MTYPRNAPTWRRLLLTAGGLLCAANILIFLLLHLVALLSYFRLVGVSAAVDLTYALRLPPTIAGVIARPWTLLTYMFVQYEFGHMLLNVIWLWAFAYIMAGASAGRRRVLLIYLTGGVAGALAYIAVAPGSAAGLVGASASISALMGWILVAIPGREVRLWPFGNVKLWVLILFVMIIFLAGGHSTTLWEDAAHVAGLLAGCCFGIYDRLRILVRHSSMRGHASSPAAADLTLDELLDKVRRSGFGSLSRVERNRLFQISSNPKDKEQK